MKRFGTVDKETTTKPGRIPHDPVAAAIRADEEERGSRQRSQGRLAKFLRLLRFDLCHVICSFKIGCRLLSTPRTLLGPGTVPITCPLRHIESRWGRGPRNKRDIKGSPLPCLK